MISHHIEQETVYLIFGIVLIVTSLIFGAHAVTHEPFVFEEANKVWYNRYVGFVWGVGCCMMFISGCYSLSKLRKAIHHEPD